MSSIKRKGLMVLPLPSRILIDGDGLDDHRLDRAIVTLLNHGEQHRGIDLCLGQIQVGRSLQALDSERFP